MPTPSRRPAYLILFAALAAAAGNGISLVTFPWLVLQRNGSAVDASIVAGAASLPLLFSTLIAGTTVDYLGRRRVSIISDVLSGSTVAAVPVLAITVGQRNITVGVLAVLAALGALFDPAGITARESMLPEAAARAGWTLDRTNGLYEAIFNVAYIVGPGLGGALIATVGGVNTMWVTAGAFGVSIAAISVLRLAGTEPPAERPERPWSGMADGVRFVWDVKVLRTLALIDLAMTGLYLPMESVLFPKYFTDRKEPAHLGWVLMALSIGGLAGALAYPLVVRRLSRRATLLAATLTLGLCTALISFLPALAVILVLCGLIGLVYGPIAPIYNYVMQTRSPPQLRGRVVGVMTSLAYAAGPLGFMLAGPLTDAAGLRTTFLVLAIPMTVIGLVSPGLPSLQDLDRAPELAVDPKP
ncbi:MFS transporter [Mycobacterium noviomagense]|uniref:Multidrug efflux pump Tap n=1 Tax=Mycobacterium noviomagense TaxID=459858 RepID=A0A7I7P973_9MYCO|nr:MFS transporter [Mycobacterium noviomagense]ORB18251.1 MFS transporter [Mycobacterium noviomagense]BBY05133.1 putative multidrug-efflux transporter [Mycobacterium noviomagense]